jgi:hypothetical protein
MGFMSDAAALFLFLSVGTVALFSFISVAAFSEARRREREAHYKSETIKKISEAQGAGAHEAGRSRYCLRGHWLDDLFESYREGTACLSGRPDPAIRGLVPPNICLFPCTQNRIVQKSKG